VSAGGGDAGAIFETVSAWGRLSAERHRMLPLHDRAAALPRAGTTALPFGNGRSYGDACLNRGGALWLTRGLDRFIAFDERGGILECEAGVLLDDIITVVLPRGWFLPVTPGTRFASLGGAIANDVHGKNHHRAGTLGEHVLALTLTRSDGQRIECTRAPQAEENPAWLRATIGGLGLTGVITCARLQLRRVAGPWLDSEGLRFDTLEEFFELSRRSETDWEYTVAWIDCVGGDPRYTRGVFFRANHADDPGPAPPPREHSLPITPPFSLVGGFSLRAFNRLYLALNGARQGVRRQALLPFFYPLDAIAGWNRMYGPRGFYQYQCVVPQAVQADATAALLAAIRASGQGSFLAVLKTFGERPAAGLLSFPRAGTTLALDFPDRGAPTEALFARLDAIVAEAGGRIYMAKDARMGRDLFRTGYPGLGEFLRYRDAGIASDLSRRLIDDA
jgi:FAD/FMN-containing dehydrogenase